MRRLATSSALAAGVSASHTPSPRPRRAFAGPRTNRAGWGTGGAALAWAAIGAAYVLTRSAWLDDFDSYNFARALSHFDVRLNQPHPPGYPLYVLLGRFVALAVHDPTQSLTLLSALSGALCVLAFAFLTRDLGLGWAGLLLAPLPLFWLSSELALSDVPGLCWACVAALFLERAQSTAARFERAEATAPAAPPSAESGLAGENAEAEAGPGLVDTSSGPAHELLPQKAKGWVSTTYLLLGAVASAVTAGVRPQDAIVPLAVGCFFTLPELVRQGRWRALWGATLLFTFACLAWLVPLVVSMGGFNAARRLLAGQGAYVASTDSLFARPFNWPDVAVRLGQFGDVFAAYLGGPASGGGLAAFLALFAVLALAATRCSRRVRWLALTWLLPYASFMIVTSRPDDPRKVLPALPPMLLLVAGALFQMSARWAGQSRLATVARAVPLLALFGWFTFRAAPLVQTLDSVPPASIQAEQYIRAHFSRSNTLIVAGLSYNAVRYELPDYPAYFLEAFNAAAFQRDLASGAYQHVILLDKEGPALPATYVGVSTRTFARNPLVLPKAAQVWMAVYQPLASVNATRLRLPPGPVHVGTSEDAPYLLDGWYRPEVIAGVPARWTRAQSAIRFWIATPAASTFRFVCVSFPARQQLTLAVNGQVVRTLPIGQGWAAYDVAVPATLLRAQSINVISLRSSRAVTPVHQTSGQSTDARPLAVAYTTFALAPA